MEKIYKCPVCGKVFGSIASLNECVNAHAQAEAAEGDEAKKIAARDAVNEKYGEFIKMVDEYNETYGEGFNVSFEFKDATPETKTSFKTIKTSNSFTDSFHAGMEEGFEDFLKKFTKEKKSEKKISSKAEKAKAKFNALTEKFKDHETDETKRLIREVLEEMNKAEMSDADWDKLISYINIIDTLF